MIKTFILHAILSIAVSHRNVQDSSLFYIQLEILRIDSAVAKIEKNNTLDKSMLIGVAPNKGQYKGIAYVSPNNKLVQKLTITFISSGTISTIYIAENKILKVVIDSNEYFPYNKSYYSRQLNRSSNPLPIEELSDAESIVQIASRLFQKSVVN